MSPTLPVFSGWGEAGAAFKNRKQTTGFAVQWLAKKKGWQGRLALTAVCAELRLIRSRWAHAALHLAREPWVPLPVGPELPYSPAQVLVILPAFSCSGTGKMGQVKWECTLWGGFILIKFLFTWSLSTKSPFRSWFFCILQVEGLEDNQGVHSITGKNWWTRISPFQDPEIAAFSLLVL